MIVLVLMFCCDVHIGCAGSTKNWQHSCVASVISDFYQKKCKVASDMQWFSTCPMHI